MSAETDRLIASLSSDLQPTGPPQSVDITALLWLVGSVGYVIGITTWFGPIRPNALTQLATETRFLLETVSRCYRNCLYRCDGFSHSSARGGNEPRGADCHRTGGAVAGQLRVWPGLPCA